MPSTISPMAIRPPPTAPPMIAPLLEECAVGTREDVSMRGTSMV